MSILKVPVNLDDHTKGPDGASLILVEYGDFQCPYCALAYQKIKNLENTFPGQFRLVFRHFPLTQLHEYALLGAMSAESAGVQGKFWEMHDLLFENQEQFGTTEFDQFAKALGLDDIEFREGLQNDILAKKIKEDFMSGVRSGVNGTPGIFVNGVKFEGPLEIDIFHELLEAA